jgi:ferredoxin
VKLRIDHDRCTGHGRCYMLAPNLFEADDDGYGQLLADEVPAEHEAEARKAVLGCPERAVLADG